jgi:hypothetical protein
MINHICQACTKHCKQDPTFYVECPKFRPKEGYTVSKTGTVQAVEV